MAAPQRRQRGRRPPVILRQTIGHSYAIEAHEDAPDPAPGDIGAFLCAELEHDDGNGMWISDGVSQINLDACGMVYDEAPVSIQSDSITPTPIYSGLIFRTGQRFLGL